jgi:hypothetical protein
MKKGIMKKIIIASVTFLALAMSSCKKEDNYTAPVAPSGSITAMVDNVPVVFGTSTMVDTFYYHYGVHVMTIEGWQGKVAASDFISFSIVRTGSPITVDSYTPTAFYYWQKSDSTSYISSNVNPPHVSITAITDSSIEGTFSSNVFNNYAVNYTSSHFITAGKFNVKFQNIPL